MKLTHWNLAIARLRRPASTTVCRTCVVACPRGKIDPNPDVDLESGSKFCYSGRALSKYRCPTTEEVRARELSLKEQASSNLYVRERVCTPRQRYNVEAFRLKLACCDHILVK